MNVKTLLLVTASAPLLLGCDILQKNSDPVVGQASQMQPFSTVEAKYRDGVKINSNEIETAEGISGVIGKIDGTVSEVQVRMNDAKTIAYVSIDGGPETEYGTSRSSFYENGNSYFHGYWYDAAGNRVWVRTSGDSYGDINIYENGAYTARGRIGLETAPEDLPDSASYSGSIYTIGEIRASGRMAVSVDFANGDIDGGMTGVASRGTSYAGSNQTIYGTVDGSVTDGHFGGTVFVGGGATGELDFAGAATGAGAQRLMGGMAGTLTVGEDDFTTGGDFELHKQYIPPEEEEL